MNCADCDCSSSEWASINRGVLLCNDCSCIHRQLGRHVSQIKHITKSRWRKTQLAMLRSLSQSGPNKYWEHLLLENSLKPSQTSIDNSSQPKKPHFSDPMHPNKSDFIREKYLNYGYFKKPKAISLSDLNAQLHASVRTGLLETSLYLLTLGAQPNYVHQTKMTTPLHVATMYNQPLQVELLLTYGADLYQVDANGDTALLIAHKKSQMSQEPLKWHLLISCLLEAQFELTDCLSYYLSRQTIEHSIDDLLYPHRLMNHLLIPSPASVQGGDNGTLVGSPGVALDSKSRHRMKLLPVNAFVELTIDLCDEIDRRDTNLIITDSQPGSAPSKQLILYFLAPSPRYTSTRNQGRQKLARLSTNEFRTLCFDVLTEAASRLDPSLTIPSPSNTHLYYNVSARPTTNLATNNKHHRSSLPLGNASNIAPTGTASNPIDLEDSHDPVYDQVAADGDYAYAMDLHRISNSPQVPPPQQPHSNHNKSYQGSQDSNSNTALLNQIDDLAGRNKLLEARNKDLERKVVLLESQVVQLREEKAVLMKGMDCKLRNNSGGAITSQLNNTSTNEGAYDIGMMNDRFNSGPWLRQEVLQASGSGSNSSRTRIQSGSTVTGVNSGSASSSSVAATGGPGSNSNNLLRYDNSDTLMVHHRSDAQLLPNNSANNNTDNLSKQPIKSTTQQQQQSHQQQQQQQQQSHQQQQHKPNNEYYWPPDSILPLVNNNATIQSPDMISLNPATTSNASIQHSLSNQVVQSVETIILHIRTLLDIANCSRPVGLQQRQLVNQPNADYLNCARSIQNVVQQLVRLFTNANERRVILDQQQLNIGSNPSDQNLGGGGASAALESNSQINLALKDLLANSRDLRMICERKGGALDMTNNSSQSAAANNAAPSNQVIQHAHEIARAAKLLLTHYQHPAAISD